MHVVILIYISSYIDKTTLYFEIVHWCPYKTWPSVRALQPQNGTFFYQASTCDCLAAQGLEHGWNFTGIPCSEMRQNFSEALQKVYFFNFLIPMCLRTQFPWGLHGKSFSPQMHHTWQTLVLDVPLKLGDSKQGILHIKLNFPTERGKTLE